LAHRPSVKITPKYIEIYKNVDKGETRHESDRLDEETHDEYVHCTYESWETAGKLMHPIKILKNKEHIKREEIRRHPHEDEEKIRAVGNLRGKEMEHNYARECAEVLLTWKYELDDMLRKALERSESWFVNRWAKDGRWIPADLYLEQLNFWVKVSNTLTNSK
jgi:hypothetical protein